MSNETRRRTTGKALGLPEAGVLGDATEGGGIGPQIARLARQMGNDSTAAARRSTSLFQDTATGSVGATAQLSYSLPTTGLWLTIASGRITRSSAYGIDITYIPFEFGVFPAGSGASEWVRFFRVPWDTDDETNEFAAPDLTFLDDTADGNDRDVHMRFGFEPGASDFTAVVSVTAVRLGDA